MADNDKRGNDLTKEQLSDAYAAGSSDGIMITEDGPIQLEQNRKPEDPSAAEPRQPSSSQ
jgi:hypothetical protein